MSASENPADLDELLAQGGGEVKTGVPFALRRPDLEDDRDHALTAGECAAEAGISASTASGHLAKLLDAGLLVVLVQGRHRYYNLAGSDVAEAVEALMGSPSV